MMMTRTVRTLTMGLVALAGISSPVAAQGPDVAATRSALERAYAANADAFRRLDVAGVMALRDSGFHTYPPDGRRRDRAAMEQYTIAFINSIRKWNSITETIDSLSVSASGDTAVVIVSQHLDRMAAGANDQVRHVETWATQREAWVRHGSRWLLWRVDQVRNQRRVVDGAPQ